MSVGIARVNERDLRRGREGRGDAMECRTDERSNAAAMNEYVCRAECLIRINAGRP